MKYTIPEIPPSNNRFIGRMNRWEYQKQKKYWANLIAAICRPKPRTPLEKAVVKLCYYFPDKRRRDPDNYSGKMILDGLVAEGIIKDDSFTNIDLLLSGKYDRLLPRTEITIELAETESQCRKSVAKKR